MAEKERRCESEAGPRPDTSLVSSQLTPYEIAQLQQDGKTNVDYALKVYRSNRRYSRSQTAEDGSTDDPPATH